jgi:hypothetical protein
MAALKGSRCEDPEHTNPDWCEYDETTGSYRDTRAYVTHLIKKCGTEDGGNDEQD